MSNRALGLFILAALVLISLLLWYSYEVMQAATEVVQFSRETN